METGDELFNRITKELKYRKIITLDFEFSISQKKLVVIINDEKFDIRDKVSSDIWNIGGNIYKSPIQTHEITVHATKAVRDFVKEFDPTFDVQRIIGMG